MAETDSVVGKVASVQGEAFAKGPDGIMRQIRVGDPVFEGEVIQTAAGGHVELAFGDGTAYFLRDKEAVTLDGMVFGGRTADAGNVIGKVASVEGQVFAKGANGGMRQLKVGDSVFEGEVIQTPAGGRVELAFNNGTAYFLRDKEAVTLDGMVFGGRAVDAREAALMPGRGGELEDISRAIAEGNSLDRLLEETSAGRSAILGKSDDGHSFVQLLRIAEAIDPLGYQFGTRDGGRLDEIVGGGAEGAGAGTGSQTVVVPDVVAATAVVATVTLTDVTVAEGAGTATISATIDNAPQTTALVLTLSNGATLIFAVGATTATSTPFAIQDDDAYVDGGSSTVSIVGSNGGGNFGLLIASDTATASITDTLTPSTVNLSGSSVSEGAAVNYTFTATLSAASQGVTT
ncbi:MAG: retention module-containing protein, partial [Sulfuritalea sp.]|nr:retention module-containing protein [Sulfuritalea sp.]